MRGHGRGQNPWQDAQGTQHVTYVAKAIARPKWILVGIDYPAITLTVNQNDRTCSNGLKLDKIIFKKQIGRKRFTNREVDKWNRLICQVVNANMIESFKIRLEIYV